MTSLGWDYYHAIGGSRDKVWAALHYEAFAADAGIFLGTCIFPGFFLKNTELRTGIHNHGISIDGRKQRFFITFVQNAFHLFDGPQHEGCAR